MSNASDRGGAAGGVPEIEPRDAWQRLTATPGDGPAPALVDVRETWEYAGGHARGAVSIPLSEFRERLGEVPGDRDVLFICHVGERSMMAARFARQQGVPHVFNVAGGTDAWQAQGLPMDGAGSETS